MKKIPYGISNYEKIVKEGYIYVDKTMFIEKLENTENPTVMFLRPRKFGKTLFTSVLENYYDINKKEEFEMLFSSTYIGKNPTSSKNKYYVLRFNFSGIDTNDTENTMQKFKNNTIDAVKLFIGKYDIDFYINENQDAEEILNSLFTAFTLQKMGQKIYVIIDEYDHFANELLGFNTEKFKELVSKNGKVRKWYEILKKGTETIVDRIFITGVAPITLDSLTSGFNIATDITKDRAFNQMMGFTKQELINLMNEEYISTEEQEKLLPIMKENYNGYNFSLKGTEKVYNSNMCLYFLKEYLNLKELPEQLIDVNIASDYSKLSKLLDLYQGEQKIKIIEQTISGEGIITEITNKFNPAMEFKEKDLVSMLFYLGYLTIAENEFGYPKLKIPNKVMRELYSEYFLEKVKKEIKISIEEEYSKIAIEIARDGKIDKIAELLHIYLSNLSNRDYQRFDEKYVKIMFYSMAMNLKQIFIVKSELEVNRKYPDILLIPKEINSRYNAVMIEFKYLKKDEKNKLKEKQEEAKRQIEEYFDFEEIKLIPNLQKYTVVAVNDEIYVEIVK